MKDVIKELVDIDEQAKKYNEETNKQKEALESQIDEEVKQIHDRYMADAKVEVEAKKKQIEKEAKRKASAEKLQKKFDENADKWVNEIVEDILK